MNYKKIYDSIISKARVREIISPLMDYGENHHILPSCMGGDGSSENMIRLTAKEHFICHALLCHIYPTEPKVIFAFHCMRYWVSENRYVSGQRYESFRLRFCDETSKRMLGNTYRQGKAKSKEECEAISRAHTGHLVSNETRLKLSVAIKAIMSDPEEKLRRSKATREGMNNPEVSDKISKAQLEKHECIYCGWITNKGNLKKYHGPTPTINNKSCLTKSIELNTSW